MVEHSHRAHFLLEAAQPVGISRKSVGQQFDCDLAPYPCVSGGIDFSHPSRADKREQLIMAELFANESSRRLTGHESGRIFQRRRTHEIAHLVFLGEQRLNLTTHILIAGASLREVTGTRFRRKLSGLAVQLTDASEPIRRHLLPYQSIRDEARRARNSSRAEPCALKP